uniref:TIR domain-containing protein n=1 Tax=Candidatus Kentrum sp. DK TaxID=2126562 RepID=A0A450SV97_9GAMM|nr:MAG: TIR domain-containing protein [Candidatus Kentron sp. DK]
MKCKLFISFIHEEEPLAVFIRDYLNNLFSGHAVFFTSAGGIPAGEKWFDKVEKEIREADSILVLLSKASITRVWVNIEVGAFWISNKNIFPMCHADLNSEDLHRPLADFQAINLYDPQGVRELIKSISNRLDLRAPPSFDPEEFCQNVMEIDKNIRKIFSSWHEIAAALRLTEDKDPEQLSAYKIENESVVTNFRIYDTVIEIGGFVQDAAVIKIEKEEDFSNKRYLILHFSNTAGVRSENLGKLVKIVVNGEVSLAHFDSHRHYNDQEYIYAENGYYAYDLMELPDKTRFFLQLVFWKISINRLRMQLYMV